MPNVGVTKIDFERYTGKYKLGVGAKGIYEIYGMQFGEPLDNNDMKLLLEDLNNMYMKVNKKESFDLEAAIEAYNDLLSYIDEAEKEAKEGKTDPIMIGSAMRKAARKCLLVTNMSDKGIITNPVPNNDEMNANQPWKLQEVHKFLNAFNYVLFMRLENPAADWNTIDAAEIEKLQDGLEKSISNVYDSEIDATYNAIKTMWKYSKEEASKEQSNYIENVEGLRRDLRNMFMASDGLADCSSLAFREVEKRIKDVLPVSFNKAVPGYMNKNKIKPPVWEFSEDVSKEKPETLRDAIRKYTEETVAYDNLVKDYKNSINELENVIGKPDPEFKFDFEMFEKDIDRLFILYQKKGLAEFDNLKDFKAHIKELVTYVKDNDAVLGQMHYKNLTSKGIALSITDSDYGAEYILMGGIGKVTGDRLGAMKNVARLENRPPLTREAVKDRLEMYAKLPKQYINDYIDSIVKVVTRSDNYPQIKIKRDYAYRTELNILNYIDAFNDDVFLEDEISNLTPTDKEIVADKRPFFEDDVIRPIFAYCKEAGLLSKEDDNGKLVEDTKLEDSLKESLNILTGWLSTYDDSFMQRDDNGSIMQEFKPELKSDAGIDMFCSINSSMALVKEIIRRSGAEVEFPGTMTDRTGIAKGLTQFNGFLLTKHLIKEANELYEQLTRMNESDKIKRKDWKNSNINVLREAENTHNELIKQIEGNKANIMKVIETLNDNAQRATLQKIYAVERPEFKELKNSYNVIKTNLEKAVDAEKKAEAARIKKRQEEEKKKRELEEKEAKKKKNEKKSEEDNELEVNIIDTSNNVLHVRPEILTLDSRINNLLTKLRTNIVIEADEEKNKKISAPKKEDEKEIVLDDEAKDIITTSLSKNDDSMYDENESFNVENNDQKVSFNEKRTQEQFYNIRNMLLEDEVTLAGALLRLNERKPDSRFTPDIIAQLKKEVERDDVILIVDFERKVNDVYNEILRDNLAREHQDKIDRDRINNLMNGDESTRIKQHNAGNNNKKKPASHDNAAAGAANASESVNRKSALFIHSDLGDRMSARGDIILCARALDNEKKYKHEEFNTMKQALNLYADAVKKYNIKSAGLGRIEFTYGDSDKEIISDADVKQAAYYAYKACKQYLEKHLDSSIRNGKLHKEITGQFYASGALRKEVAIKVMNSFRRLPEAWEMIKIMDKTVTNGNDAKRIHSSDLRDLSDTLKVKNNNKYYYLEERIEMMNEAQRSQTKQVQPKARGMHK